MTNPPSGPGAGTRITATVKWYDPAKGFGFLVPDDDLSDIYCRESALTAVGLATLLPEAAVACETATAARGPEVFRILSIDFSTAAPRTASLARPAANGQIAAGPDGSAVSGRQSWAIVKWFDADKGYGFLEPEDGSADLFCHMTAVHASGRNTLPEGAAVTCAIVQGDRGPQVSRIFLSRPRSPEPARRTTTGPSTRGIRARRPAGRPPPSWSCRALSSSSTR
ncbi:MAG: cold shock domain-containing protein [Rhodospirillales bacterium]|nr:cold shock domain-containing protein [Rhodospirillales bacterium]